MRGAAFAVLAIASAASVAAIDHVALAMQADEAGDFEEAIKHFKLFAEESPDDPTAFNNLGVATMRYGIEMMMARRRLKGKELFTAAAENYRKALLLDRYNSMAGDNLRGVLHALESNFEMKPTAEDKELLEDVGFPYADFDSKNAVQEDDPVHNRIMKKLGVPGASEGDAGAEPDSQLSSEEPGQSGSPPRRRFGGLANKYRDEEPEGADGANDGGRGGGEADEEEEPEEAASDEREAELERIRAVKNPYIRAVKLFDAGAIAEAVEFLCTPERIRVAPRAKEVAANKPAFKTVARAAATLKVCGVVVMDKVIPKKVAAALAQRVEDMMEDRLASVDVEADGKSTFESTETAKRSDGRYEFMNPLEAPFTDADVIQNPFYLPVLRRAMGSRLEMDTFSTVVSLPNCPTQHWHTDAGQLFPRAGLHLPAHGVVVFAAMANVTREMGPTEFAPGSHVQCGKEEHPKPVHYEDGSILDLCRAVPGNRLLHADLPLGSVVLFDFRIFHRGGPNSSPRRRPLLYTTYLREWYHDKVNFHQQFSASFDALSPAQRKLLNRLDHKLHVGRVQEKLRALGGDPEESGYDFHVYSYDSKDLGPQPGHT